MKRLTSILFLLRASTTDSSDRNLMITLVPFKPPDKSFASKVINLGVVNVRTKI